VGLNSCAIVTAFLSIENKQYHRIHGEAAEITQIDSCTNSVVACYLLVPQKMCWATGHGAEARAVAVFAEWRAKFVKSNIDLSKHGVYNTVWILTVGIFMPRYRGTNEATASLVGKLLLLIAAGKETSATLAAKLGVSARQVNRYIVGLKDAGLQIERRGVPTHGEYWLELHEPCLVWHRRATRVRDERT
jgi:hypothetical protein